MRNERHPRIGRKCGIFGGIWREGGKCLGASAGKRMSNRKDRGDVVTSIGNRWAANGGLRMAFHVMFVKTFADCDDFFCMFAIHF